MELFIDIISKVFFLCFDVPNLSVMHSKYSQFFATCSGFSPLICDFKQTKKYEVQCTPYIKN